MHIAPKELFLSKVKVDRAPAQEALTVYYDSIMAPFKKDVLKSVTTLQSFLMFPWFLIVMVIYLMTEKTLNTQ